MSTHPKMKAVSAPKQKIDRKDRLCFYRREANDNDKATNMLWPAVFYEDLKEYLADLGDEMTPVEKSKVAMDLMDSFKKGNEGEINILRPLGKKSYLHYIKSVVGKDQYFDYTSSICHALQYHAGNPNDFTSDEEYLQFMDALTESEEIFRGPEFPNNEPTWKEFGLKTLQERGSRQAAGIDNDVAMTEENAEDTTVADEGIRAIDFQEAATPKNTAAFFETEASTAEPAPADDTDILQEALEAFHEQETDDAHYQELEEDVSSSASEAPVLTNTDDAGSLEGTPRTHNHSSSSATVVSTDTNDGHVTVASGGQTPARKQQWPFERPELNESMDAEDIAFALQMASWTTKLIDGKKYYLFPEVDAEDMKLGENAFLTEYLVDFVKKHNYFKEIDGELFSPSSKVKENEADEAEMGDEEVSKPLSPMHTTPKTKAASKKEAKGKRGRRAKPKTTESAKKAVPVKSTASTKHRKKAQTSMSRKSPRSSRSSVTPVKTRHIPDDPFYQFVNLIKVLQNCFDWQYTGHTIYNWVYVRGDSELGKNGVRGDDYFVEEWEVEEYCMAHNYKEKFDELPEDKDEEEEATETGKVEDPNFITPPPKKNTIGAMQ